MGKKAFGFDFAQTRCLFRIPNRATLCGIRTTFSRSKTHPPWTDLYNLRRLDRLGASFAWLICASTSTTLFNLNSQLIELMVANRSRRHRIRCFDEIRCSSTLRAYEASYQSSNSVAYAMVPLIRTLACHLVLRHVGWCDSWRPELKGSGVWSPVPSGAG